MKKDNEPILTICTPTYNQEKYIKQCLDSLVNQKTEYKYEILVSDDCSTDNTRNIVNDYKKKYPNKIRTIFRDKNIGPMENLFQTLNEIHTKYVALCDGDDFWVSENKVQKQVSFLEKHKDYNIVFNKSRIFFEDGSQEPFLFPGIKVNNPVLFDEIINDNLITANSVMYRWKFNKKNSLIKIIPENIMPGDYFIHLVHLKGSKAYYLDEVMSAYRRQPKGMWWYTSQPDKRFDFYYNSGIKQLNFYDYFFNEGFVNDNMIHPQRDWILYYTMLGYFYKRKYSKMKYFYEKYYALYESTFEKVYHVFSKKNKIIFAFFCGKEYFLKHIKRFFKRIITRKECD